MYPADIYHMILILWICVTTYLGPDLGNRFGSYGNSTILREQGHGNHWRPMVEEVLKDTVD